MKTIAFTHRIVEDTAIEAATKWLSLLQQECTIYNIPNYRVEDLVKSNTAVVTFGKIAGLAVQQYIAEKKLTNVHHLQLPAIRSLEPREENRVARAAAHKQLEEMRRVIEEERYFPLDVIVKKEDLPDLDRRQIALLEKLTTNNGKSSCFQTSINGRLVEISTEKKAESKADIHLTFQELLAIHLALDVLGTKEVTIVSTPQETSSLSPGKSTKPGN